VLDTAIAWLYRAGGAIAVVLLVALGLWFVLRGVHGLST
jgi:hypothetical protein